MSTKAGLGKGLDALIPKGFDSGMLQSTEKIHKVPIDKVVPNPDQPRKVFDETALSELAASIKAHGIVQPLVVTRAGDKYRIVAGERRWRAAKQAGVSEVPAVVRSLKEIEELEIAIIENVQRVDLSPLEQALSIERLHDQFSMSYSDIARRLGRAVSTIHNTVRLLQLPDAAKQALRSSEITEGHARAILALRGQLDKQEELLHEIINKGWSVRQAEQFVVALRSSGDDAQSPKTVKKHMAASNQDTERLAKRLSAKVAIKRTARGGRLEIHFSDDDELGRITTALLANK